MQVDVRRERRHSINGTLALSWIDEHGVTHSLTVQARDTCASGICVEASRSFEPGALVFLNGPGTPATGHAVVRHCTQGPEGYRVGLEFEGETRKSVTLDQADVEDYYEFLQISPKAEAATIHRIYRFMALRFHPDNPQTGDPEKFLLLNRIYYTLSDPQRRTEYDASRNAPDAEVSSVFELSTFVNGIEGEMNRRLGILAFLYNRRRANPQEPSISLWDLEKRMALPREYLDFATWYLKSKTYITVADNSDFTLTAAGVDYVEANAEDNPVLNRLLSAGPRLTDPGVTRHETKEPHMYRLGPGTGPRKTNDAPPDCNHHPARTNGE